MKIIFLYNMYFRLKKMSSNKIHDKFDKFQNNINLIKIKIINKTKLLLT